MEIGGGFHFDPFPAILHVEKSPLKLILWHGESQCLRYQEFGNLFGHFPQVGELETPEIFDCKADGVAFAKERLFSTK